MQDKFGKTALSKTQWLADLHWTAQSPLMVSLDQYAPSQTDFNNCRQLYSADGRIGLQGDSELYSQCLATLTSRFLGPYFECLWSSLVCLSGHLRLIAHGLQIHEAGKTLGEFDFLLQLYQSSPANTITLLPEIIHQEVAVKFYLGVSGTDHLGCTSPAWIGPNQIDRLDLKLFDMLTRQIRLSQQTGIKAKLAEMLCPEICSNSVIKPEIVIKGYLFHPYGQKLPLPSYVNPSVAAGQWLSYSELIGSELTEADTHNQQWIVLPKLCWLAPAVASEHDLMNNQQLITTLRKKMATGKPQLLARMRAKVNHENPHSPMAEIARYFIVGDHWLAHAKQSVFARPLKDITQAMAQT